MSWVDTLRGFRSNETMQIEKVSINLLVNWYFEAGVLIHREKRFFRMFGARILRAFQNKVDAWQQPLLQEAQDEMCLLVTDGTRYLLTMRADPGNPPEKRFVLLAPTIQGPKCELKSSPRAYLCAHEDMIWTRVSKDGSRFIKSDFWIGILVIDPDDFNVEVEKKQPNEVVLGWSELGEAYMRGDVNSCLREAVGFASFHCGGRLL